MDKSTKFTKIYRIILGFVIVSVIIASIIGVYYSLNKNEISNENIRADANEFMYILKEYENKIGVYKANETEPFKVIDVYVNNLPSVDQYELKSGISVQNDDKLRMIIEDYES